MICECIIIYMLIITSYFNLMKRKKKKSFKLYIIKV